MSCTPVLRPPSSRLVPINDVRCDSRSPCPEFAVTTVAEQCAHRSVSCLNEFEFIRKYRCADCGGVMMCACDADVGRAFLPHQLEEGSDYGTRARVRVNLGFLPAACRECRGLPREAHPAAEIHGRTSKIKRYYWREIWFL
jgi:hypothetical protein